MKAKEATVIVEAPGEESLNCGGEIWLVLFYRLYNKLVSHFV